MKFKTLLKNYDIELNSQKIEQLEKYTDLLLEWNSIHNLTGSKDKIDIYKNILDSIYPVKLIKEPQRFLDVGSGAGFPAIPLSIVWDKTDATLCEPRNKRASFLKLVSIELDLNERVNIEKCRVEDLIKPPFKLITSRAVNKVDILIKITKHLTSEDTDFLFYKGENVNDEVAFLKKSNYNYYIKSRGNRRYLNLRANSKLRLKLKRD